MARSSKSNNSTANLGFEAKLWRAADTFDFSLSPFDFLVCLPPHGMAGFVLARFYVWVKHGCHRTKSREETGDALSEFYEACRTRFNSAIRQSACMLFTTKEFRC